MTIAYFDCLFRHIRRHDLGALVDAGVSIDVLGAELAKLNLPGYELKAEKVQTLRISATKVHVVTTRRTEIGTLFGHTENHRSSTLRQQ